MRAAKIVSCIAFIQFLLGEASVIKYSRHRVFKDWTARPPCRFIVSVHNAARREAGVKRENVNGERRGWRGEERDKHTGNIVHRARKPHKVRQLAITRATRYTRHTGSARRKRDRHSDNNFRKLIRLHGSVYCDSVPPDAPEFRRNWTFARSVPIDITSCQTPRDKEGKMDCTHYAYRETPRNVITILPDAEIP